MSKPVILVVDDDPQVLAAVRRDIRSRYRESYTVMGAGSGAEALATARELKARGDSLALLLSDQRMPGMLGVDLLAQVRELYPIARRVLLTAYSDIEAAVRAINDAHLDHYLSKPWDPPEEHLYPVLDELLDEWHVMRPRERVGLRVIGHQWSPRSHAVKDFLASNLIPYEWMDAERDESAPMLLGAGGISQSELPALFLESGEILKNPSMLEIANALGRATSATHELYDLAIVGAGPAGLAAAVYASSEGLRTLLLDRHSPGGQAGTSSRIENYLGFPNGVSGSELTRRAVAQAVRLGTEFITPVEVVSVTIESGYKKLQLSDGREIVARAMLATTGMVYREHTAGGVTQHAGAGVYYGAATTEAAACAGKRVLVIGGGNSAGQAAMHLSRYASEVHIAVRRDGLSETMSRYLIDQILATENIRLRPFTELERVEGGDRLERAVLKSLADGASISEDMHAVFVFIGTRPHSDWLPYKVVRDAKGFVVTGREALTCDGFAREWKEEREPLPLETSSPGVFAAGDLRAGAMNRVASAVGEGAMAVRLVHEYLALT